MNSAACLIQMGGGGSYFIMNKGLISQQIIFIANQLKQDPQLGGPGSQVIATHLWLQYWERKKIEWSRILKNVRQGYSPPCQQARAGSQFHFIQPAGLSMGPLGSLLPELGTQGGAGLDSSMWCQRELEWAPRL